MENQHFLSYSSRDGGDIAMALYWDLLVQQPSVPVWIDKRRLQPGTNWKQSIQEAVVAARSFILVMTPQSVEADSASGKELDTAQRYSKSIIPLRFYPDLEPPPWLGPLQAISFVEDDEGERRGPDQPWSDLSWERGVEQLRQKLIHLKSPLVPTDMLESTLERLLQKQVRAQKDLAKERQASERRRIQLEIDELERQINSLSGIAEDPAGAARQEQRRIEDGLHEQATRPTRAQVRGVYVNAPPALVPRYFQGRDRELDRLVAFLKDDVQRLLMVNGRGGIGKTALVCHLLESLAPGGAPAEHYGLRLDGVVYVSVEKALRLTAQSLVEDLARSLPPDSAERLRHKIAAGETASTRQRLDALLEEMSTGCRVLLLDNLEDIVDENSGIRNREIADALAAVLTHRHHHGLKVIVTTREAPAELQMIEPARQGILELRTGLASPYAEQVLRAMDPGDDLGLKSAPEALLQEARERTEGHPKALEAIKGILLANRHLTLKDLLADTEKLLPGQVLQMLIGEAFDQFEPVTQWVMEALAIYGRPVSATAVDFLLQPYAPGLNSEPILQRLVNLMFVRIKGQQYSLHRVDQAYVFRRILPGEPTDSARAEPPLFTRFALQLLAADYCKQARREPQLIASMSDLEPQLAEIDLRCAAGDVETAAQVLRSIDNQFLRKWAEYQAIADFHERLVDSLEDLSLKEASYESLSKAYTSLGNYDQASAYTRLGMRIAEELDDPRKQANLRLLRGNDYSSIGRNHEALEEYQAALDITEQIGDLRPQSKCLTNIGCVYRDFGEPEKALGYHEKALAIARDNGFVEEGAFYACYAGFALLDLGRYEEALARAAEGLDNADESGNWRSASYCGYAQALGWFLLRDWKAAATAIRRAKEKAVPENAPDLFALSGLIAVRLEESQEARHAFAEACRRADAFLENNTNNHVALDAKALALFGRVLCQTEAFRDAAVEVFRDARRINSDRGVVERALRLFDALEEQDTERRLAGVRADLLRGVPTRHGAS